MDIWEIFRVHIVQRDQVDAMIPVKMNALFPFQVRWIYEMLIFMIWLSGAVWLDAHNR